MSSEMASGKHRDQRARGRQVRDRRGYSLVILIVALTVLNVGVALALPVWTTYVQREKEEELIFRGLQYAEAIRVFQARNGRLPIRLEELLEVEPRVLRQLWPNPMREDGRWGLIIETGPRGGRPRGGLQGSPTGVPGNPAPETPTPGTPGGAGQPGAGGVILSGGEGEAVQGPIRGVYDPEGLTAIKTWMGSTNTSEWQFTTDALQPERAVAAGGGNPGALDGNRRGGLSAQPVQGIPAGPNAGQPWPVNAGTVGRPFPPDVQVQTIAQPQAGRDLNPQNPGGGNRPVQRPGQPARPGGQLGEPVARPGQPTQPVVQPRPGEGGGGDGEN